MNERIKFIAAYLDHEEPFSEICARFGVSRKTGYKWVERYEIGGVNGLADQSRAPRTHPHAVAADVVSALLAVRHRHPRWGPRKLLVLLKRQWPQLVLPVASTVGEILRRNGLVKPPGRRRSSHPYGERLREYARPNAVWCADFKGHFPVAGKRCHPLTVTDGFSRYLLRCEGMRRPLSAPVQHAFEAVFREFGLPDVIRTDNGAPFSTLAPGGLSRLAIWWIKLGIRPERIMPGRPEQNGRHERMHRTLKAETARPPRNSFSAQQKAFDGFRREYNQVRPHEALGQETPAAHYQPSPRSLPRKLPSIDYPDGFRVERTYPNGVITLNGVQWYISGCLRGESIGLEAVGDGCWKVHFGPIALGLLDERRWKELRNRRQLGTLVRLDGEISPKRLPPTYRR